MLPWQLAEIKYIFVFLNVKRSVFTAFILFYFFFCTECGSLLQIVQIMNEFLVPSMQWESK